MAEPGTVGRICLGSGEGPETGDARHAKACTARLARPGVGVLERFSFRFGGGVAAMTDVVATFGGGEARQTLAEERPERVDRSAAGLADDGLELGEAQLDGVEVGAVGREEAQRRADGFNGVAHAVDFVSGEIVGNHDVAGLQRRHEDLFDVGEEADVHICLGSSGEGPETGDARQGAQAAGDGGTARLEKDEAARSGGVPTARGGRDVGAIVFGHADGRVARLADVRGCGAQPRASSI